MSFFPERAVRERWKRPDFPGSAKALRKKIVCPHQLCGTRFMARRAGKVCGVEIIPEAIENAKQNAVRNGIGNAEFYVGKAEEVLPAYVQARRAAGEDPDIDVICVDPPRRGCDAKCLETILEIQPERVVYVSCDPATLARDLRILADGGYRLQKVRPVDQFGHTVHVETVVLLTQSAP